MRAKPDKKKAKTSSAGLSNIRTFFEASSRASASGSSRECESENQDGSRSPNRSPNLTIPSTASTVDPSEDCVSSDSDKSESESAEQNKVGKKQQG
jgi:hypothetical protein